jgi:hypothetical protein
MGPYVGLRVYFQPEGWDELINGWVVEALGDELMPRWYLSLCFMEVIMDHVAVYLAS